MTPTPGGTPGGGPKGPEGPPVPKERPWALSLSAEGAIGGAFNVRTKAQASKNTDILCTLKIN